MFPRSETRTTLHRIECGIKRKPVYVAIHSDQKLTKLTSSLLRLLELPASNPHAQTSAATSIYSGSLSSHRFSPKKLLKTSDEGRPLASSSLSEPLHLVRPSTSLPRATHRIVLQPRLHPLFAQVQPFVSLRRCARGSDEQARAAREGERKGRESSRAALDELPLQGGEGGSEGRRT